MLVLHLRLLFDPTANPTIDFIIGNRSCRFVVLNASHWWRLRCFGFGRTYAYKVNIRLLT